MRGINIKAIHKFMNISRVLIGLINETLRYFPLGLVTIFVVLFYFIPDGVLGDIIHEWQKTDVSGKIYIVRLWLKATLVCVFASVFLKYLCSDAFMPKKRVNKNSNKTNKQSGER
ncbi:hypothetical protein [Escherichia coli]|uniref:hypothetical protein n=1 Tax=Escherichia coli TaxID=562 RepID=UPI00092DC04D|nr:hypothetical protein [Escherichia coli]APJ80135.1 hypothetical protein RG28_28315 [Escherichia coli]